MIFSLKSPEDVKNRLVPTVCSFIYIPTMFCIPILFLKKFNNVVGVGTVLWVVLMSKCCDIGGMLVGACFGRRKLAPQLSPAKTVEGVFGGIVLSSIVGLLPLLIPHLLAYLPKSMSVRGTVNFSICIACLATAGDLLESAIKRLSGAKDSGTMFPGIGGMFDLTDSLLFALPFGVIYTMA